MRALLFLSVVLVPGSALAADGASYPAQLLKALAGLLFVLGLIAGIYALFKRYSRVSSVLRGGGHLDVVEARQLGARRAVAIVRAGGSHFLVGMGDDGVRLISPVTLDDCQPPEQALPALAIPRELLGLAMSLRSALTPLLPQREGFPCPRCPGTITSANGEEFVCGSCRGHFKRGQSDAS